MRRSNNSFNSSPLLIQLISHLLALILHLETRIRELENTLNLNSSNSCIPPSNDPDRSRTIPNSCNLRKTPGGQKGHQGITLLAVDNPDVITEDRPYVCSGYGITILTELSRFSEERQKIEIPPIRFNTLSTAYTPSPALTAIRLRKEQFRAISPKISIMDPELRHT